jgi:trimeric autotransporter adhesin
MKKSLSFLAIFFLTALAFAQAPQKMSYQAVIRDNNSNLITSTTVGMRVSILQGSPSGTDVFVETHTPTTNLNGLLTLEIGTGSVVSGSFSSIDWANGPYFIKTETDPTGGANYTITGSSELLSVPYALHALSVSSNSPGQWEQNGTNELFTMKSVGIGSNNPMANNSKLYILNPDGATTQGSGKAGIKSIIQGTDGENSAVYGHAISTSAGQNIGIHGVAEKADMNRGLKGYVLSNGINWKNVGTEGIVNTVSATGGRGVSGNVFGNGDFASGVWGEASLENGETRGVSGYALSRTGNDKEMIGTLGFARGDWNPANGTGTGSHFGVLGRTDGSTGPNNYGTYGLSLGAGARNYGAVGESYGTGSFNLGVVGFGRSTTGSLNIGVYGAALTTGATSNYGVYGSSTVVETTGYNTGVYGYAEGRPENYAVDGTSSSTIGDSYGTTGWAYGTNTNYGIYGYAASGATNYAGYFNGDVHITGVLTNPSDRKLKSDVKGMTSALSLIGALKPVTYYYNKEMVAKLNLDSKLQYGFVAQEIEAILPQLVKNEKSPVYEITTTTNEIGSVISTKTIVENVEYKAVNYIGLIPVLTKAIQEQQEQIDALIKLNNELLQRVKDLEKK